MKINLKAVGNDFEIKEEPKEKLGDFMLRLAQERKKVWEDPEQRKLFSDEDCKKFQKMYDDQIKEIKENLEFLNS